MMRPFSLAAARVLLRAPVLSLAVALLALQPWGAPSTAVAQAASGGLVLSIVPPVLIADGTVQRALYVQLTNLDGNPMVAAEDTVVSLVPSNAVVVSVPSQIVVRSGESYEIVPLTTSSLTGSAVITAVSRGRVSASAEVTTVSAFDADAPVRLALHAVPSKMIEGNQRAGKLAVVLLDDEGRAVPADRPLAIVLTSSAPEVARVPARVVIPAGTHFALADLTSVDTGSASIAAIRAGSVSEPLEVHVVAAGGEAAALIMDVVPPTLTAGAGAHEGLMIWAVDVDGNPAPMPCTRIHMASSVPETLDLAPVLDTECAGNPPYVLTSVDVGHTPGAAELSAAATGLLRASSLEAVQGRLPAQLRAHIAPAMPLRLDSRPAIAVVEVLDHEGIPVTTHSGIPVTLVGGVETLQDILVIPAGRGFAALNLPKPEDDGTVSWWATSPGLTAAPLAGDYTSLPVSVEIQASERPLFPGDEMQIRVDVRSQGLPLSDARLTWSSTQGTLHNSSDRTDDSGTGLATYRAVSPDDGAIRVTAAKAGYQPASAEVTTHVVAGRPEGDSGTRVIGLPVSYLFALAASGLVVFFAYQYSYTFRSWVRGRLASVRRGRDRPPEPAGPGGGSPLVDDYDGGALETPGYGTSTPRHAGLTDLDAPVWNADESEATHGSHLDMPGELHHFIPEGVEDETLTEPGAVEQAGSDGGRTLSSFAAEWLDNVRTAVKPKTLESYDWALRLHVLPRLGRVALADLKAPDIQRLYEDVMAGGLSPKSARNIHLVVHAMLGRAARMGVVPHNVADLVDPPRPPQRELPAFTLYQARSLLAAARDHRLRALIVLAITTGARSGELLGLTWDDVDLEGAVVDINKSLQKQGRRVALVKSSRTRSRRKVAIPDTAVEALRWHRARQAEESLSIGPKWRNDLDLVFTTRVGTPLDRTNVLRRELRPLLKKAGLPESLRFSDLRHIAACLALGQGTPVVAVSEMLGHADAAATLRLYGHAVPSSIRQVADTMETALGA